MTYQVTLYDIAFLLPRREFEFIDMIFYPIEQRQYIANCQGKHNFIRIYYPKKCFISPVDDNIFELFLTSTKDKIDMKIYVVKKEIANATTLVLKVRPQRNSLTTYPKFSQLKTSRSF